MSDTKLWNHFIDTNKASGDVPAAYATLVDLGTDYIYRGLSIISTLDAPVLIKFTNPLSGAVASELLIPPNTVSPASGYEFSPSDAWHNGVIEYKYAVAAPTEGTLKMVSWRAEK